MKKTIRLTEKDLTNLIKRIVNEDDDYKNKSMYDPYYGDDDEDEEEWGDNYDNLKDREELTDAVMALLKPYYEKHGEEITLDFIDDIKAFLEDGLLDGDF